MDYNYKFTPLAVQDIDESLTYISKSLSNPSAANDLYAAISKEIESIQTFPYAYPDCSCFLIDDENIRHAVIGSYALIYEVSKKEALIKFLRFLYAGRDISRTNIIPT